MYESRFRDYRILTTLERLFWPAVLASPVIVTVLGAIVAHAAQSAIGG
jgi:hypothetical protein